MVNYDLKHIYDEDGRKEVSRWIKDYSRKDPLRVLNLPNATILPKKKSDKEHPDTWMGFGGVVDSDNEFVPLSGIKHVTKDTYVFGGKYEYDIESVDLIDEEVVYIGPMFNHWGHFMYDFITRLWYCLESSDCRIAYCGWGFDEGELYGSYRRFFELLNIDLSRLIDIRKPTKFANVIIPEQSYLRNQYVTGEYLKILNKACSNVSIDGLTPYKKIYFSRDNFIRRSAWYREYGEKVLQETFKKNGFVILDPAKLSLDEQIYYMHNCDQFAVIASSTGADTAFMKEGAERIYIKKGFYMDPDLSQLDFATNAKNVAVVDCWFRPYKSYKASHSSGPHMLGATRLFKDYLNEHNYETLSSGTYGIYKIKVYLWFLIVIIRNAIFKVLYPVYFNTFRKIIRR